MAFKILEERFPHIAFMQNLHGSIDNVKRLYKQNIPKASLVFVCGCVGVQQTAEQHIVMIEEDVKRLNAFLHWEGAEELLKNPRFHLHFAMGSWSELIDVLTKQFPIEDVDVIGPLAKRYKNQILEKAFLHRQLHLEEIYKFRLFRNIERNFRRLPNAFFVHEHRNFYKNVPAVVCGAGPSLYEAATFFQHFQGVIFAGGSAVSALAQMGVDPHYAVAFDPNPEELCRLQGVGNAKTPLLYGNRVLPEVFDLFEGPIGYVKSMTGGLVEAWLEEQIGICGPSPMASLSQEALSVTTSSLAIAQYLGCHPILLAGVDLAYTGGARYAQGVVASEDNHPGKEAIQYKGCTTTRQWILESRAISQFAKQCKEQTFYTLTQAGLGFSGIEYRNPNHLSFEKQDIEILKDPSNQCAKGALQKLKKSVERIIGVIEEYLDHPLIEMKMLALEDEPAYICFIASVIPSIEIELSLKSRQTTREKWPFLLETLKEIQRVFPHEENSPSEACQRNGNMS